MSDYGLLIKNNSSEIQIDSTYRNYFKESSNTETINGGEIIDITGSTLVPLILIRPEQNYWGSQGYLSKDGSNYAHFLLMSEYGAGDTDIDWICCRETATLSGDAYGLLIYNSDGDLVFDGGHNYMKIRQVTTVSLDNNVNDYQDVSHSGISDPYYLLAGRPMCWIRTTSYQRWYPVGVEPLSSTSVRVRWGQVWELSGGTPGSYYVNYDFPLFICEL